MKVRRRDFGRSAIPACATDRLRRREAASSVRSAAYCGRRKIVDFNRPFVRDQTDRKGLKLGQTESVLFRHPINANSMAWQYLPKILVDRPIQIGRGVALRLARSLSTKEGR